jgi:type I restriction enzyme M protein
VQARTQALREALIAWWTAHAPGLADLPQHRALNRVRAEFLDTFVAALQLLAVLDRFKLAGVIATWWTDTLPDFKTLLENGFPGVIDGWVDAIADALEDDEAAGPAFDPFGHKLVRGIMTDYLAQIAEARADIARFKSEKEAFEQSNAPDDADEEEVTNWNYARDLDRQIKELKADNRDALRELAKSERTAVRVRATAEEKRSAAEAKAALAPYEQIKANLAAARTRYRELTGTFVDQLKGRCAVMTEDQKRFLVLELFAQDVRAGLDAAVSERRQELVRSVEGLWDKYRVTLTNLSHQRGEIEHSLEHYLKVLAYL